MTRFLRATGAAIAFLGAALWFFGGFNRGASVWRVETRYTNQISGQIEIEKGTVFRPGPGFLGLTVAVGTVLWAWGNRKGEVRPTPQP